MKTLEDKIKFAIHLLQAAERKAAEAGQPVEICYSGGKDSDVILELARMAKSITGPFTRIRPLTRLAQSSIARRGESR